MTNTNDNQDSNIREYYHDKGALPDRYYHQLNKKSAQENYSVRRKSIQDYYNQKQYIEATMQELIENALRDYIIKQI